MIGSKQEIHSIKSPYDLDNFRRNFRIDCLLKGIKVREVTEHELKIVARVQSFRNYRKGVTV